MKGQILDMLSIHGIFADPSVVDYLCTKERPIEYCDRLIKVEDEPPLFLDMDVLAQLEESIRNRSMDAQQADQTDLGHFEDRTQGSEAGAKVPMDPGIKNYGGSSTNSTGARDQMVRASPKDITSERQGTSLLGTGKGLLAPDFEPVALDIESNVRIIKEITNRSTCEGALVDFTDYFNSRYQKLKKLLRNRLEMRSSTSIDYAKAKMLPGEVKLIGIVSDVRTAPWGGVSIKVEDDTAEITAILGTEEMAIEDEVLGLIGKLDDKSSKFGVRLRCNQIVRPGITTSRNFKKAKDPIYAMFISDIHMGSNTFLYRPWKNLIRWINGYIDAQRDLSSRLKYMVISGDIVDGIGVYPNQDSELKIKDIYAQYEEIARQLSFIPDHIEMIILPGNHDAIRPAEPQPTFPKEITKLFPKNCTFVGNPSIFTLHGVEVLAYHGRSMDDLIPALKLSYDQPIEVMKRMLHMRHLAPIYGQRTPIAPEKEDFLVIDKVPDIFVTGHLHKTGVKHYRNVLMIQASTWQSQTSFQRMMNLQPEPAKAIMVDLQTLNAKNLNFAG